MHNEFYQLLEKLRQNQVAFIVIGGVACALNGFVRTTEDVDILVEVSELNLKRLLTTLQSWGDGYAREFSPADFSLEPGCVRLVEDFPLDIFTLVSGKKYEEYLPRARLSPHGFRYLGPADLMQTKQNTMREKDHIDLLALRRIMQEEKAQEDKS